MCGEEAMQGAVEPCLQRALGQALGTARPHFSGDGEGWGQGEVRTGARGVLGRPLCHGPGFGGSQPLWTSDPADRRQAHEAGLRGTPGWGWLQSSLLSGAGT